MHYSCKRKREMETIKQKLSSSDNYTVSSGDQESEGKLVEQNTIA